MLLPKLGMYGSQSVSKAYTWGPAACRKTFKCYKCSTVKPLP